MKGQAVAEGYRRQRFAVPGEVLIQIEDIRCGGLKRSFKVRTTDLSEVTCIEGFLVLLKSKR